MQYLNINNFIDLIQYSYFIQLITDANGILVLLKFLTEKFNEINNWTDEYLFSSSKISIKKRLQETNYKILCILKNSCFNSPEKIKSYLIEYNAFVNKNIFIIFFAKRLLHV